MATPFKFSGWKRPADNAAGLHMRVDDTDVLTLGEGISSLSSSGAVSGALLFGRGTSSSRVTSTAAGKFVSLYFDNTVTTGSSEGLYTRTYQSGAGTGVTMNAGRIFGTVNDVTIGTARGLHASLSFGTSGLVSGLGAAVEATLHIPNSATQSGTITAVKAAINSDGATSDPAGSRLSFIRVENQGNATGAADVDTDAACLDFSGFTIGGGNMIESSVTEANYAYSVRCRLPDGTLAYMMLASAVG